MKRKMKLINGDCLEELKKLEDNSVDSIVTDPPYFLINENGAGFMGKEWDGIMSLWKYQWSDKPFADFVTQLLKQTRIDASTDAGSSAQSPARTLASSQLTPSSALSAKTLSTTQTKAEGSVRLLVLTKRDLLALLPAESYVHTSVVKYLHGVENSVLFAIPLLSLGNEHKAFAVKAVTALSKAKGCEVRTTAFSSTVVRELSDAIEAMIGTSFDGLSIKETTGNADIVANIVSVEKSKLTTLSPLEREEITRQITLLLCAYRATRTSSKIPRDLIGAFFRSIFLEANRVLKPGGHVIAFAGSRTYQWLATSIEDAGFEIRDQIMYIYGSGFPKSLNIQKAGAGKEWAGWGTALKPAHEPCVLARKPLIGTVAENVLTHGTGGLNIDGCRVGNEVLPAHTSGDNSLMGGLSNNDKNGGAVTPERIGRFPANLIHDGSEEVVGLFPHTKTGNLNRVNTSLGGDGIYQGGVGREDIGHKGSEGSAARFFQKCEYTLEHDKMSACKHINASTVVLALRTIQATIDASAQTNAGDWLNEQLVQNVKSAGIACEKCATSIALELAKIRSLVFNREELLATQDFIGNFKSSTPILNLASIVAVWDNTDTTPTTQNLSQLFGSVLLAIDENTSLDTLAKAGEGNDQAKGTRFLYQAKASKKDRDAGLEGFEAKFAPTMGNGIGGKEHDPETATPKKNCHPTVKPTDLMRYLCRLVTPPGGIVLDPFMGSGSTGKAALLEGFKFIGIERESEYVEIARARIEHVKKAA